MVTNDAPVFQIREDLAVGRLVTARFYGGDVDVYELTQISKMSAHLRLIGGYLFGRRKSFVEVHQDFNVATMTFSSLFDAGEAMWLTLKLGERYLVEESFDKSDAHHGIRTPDWKVGRVLVIDRIDSFTENDLTYAGVFFHWEDNGKEEVVPVGIFQYWYLTKLMRL